MRCFRCKKSRTIITLIMASYIWGPSYSQSFFVAAEECVVTDIRSSVDVPSRGNGFIEIVRVPMGEEIENGIKLHLGCIRTQEACLLNILTLTDDKNLLTLQPGDRIAARTPVVKIGEIGKGVVSVAVKPVSQSQPSESSSLESLRKEIREELRKELNCEVQFLKAELNNELQKLKSGGQKVSSDKQQAVKKVPVVSGAGSRGLAGVAARRQREQQNQKQTKPRSIHK